MKRIFLLAALFLAAVLAAGKGSAAMDKPVYDSPLKVQPLGKGGTIPDGQLATLGGQKVRLGALVAQKPSVLIFYRGGWCPFCNLQMGQLVKIEPQLERMGYQILAITPDKPESLKASLDKHGITYTLLSDSSLEVTRRFGLAYRLDDKTLAAMKGHGVDLDSATGNSLHELPVPAAYVVDTKGLVHFVYYNPDIKVRVNPEELLKAAKEALE